MTLITFKSRACLHEFPREREVRAARPWRDRSRGSLVFGANADVNAAIRTRALLCLKLLSVEHETWVVGPGAVLEHWPGDRPPTGRKRSKATWNTYPYRAYVKLRPISATKASRQSRLVSATINGQVTNRAVASPMTRWMRLRRPCLLIPDSRQGRHPPLP